MSLTRDRKQIHAELARLEGAELRVRRQIAYSAASRELQQRELDAIVTERQRWQGLLTQYTLERLSPIERKV